MMLYSALASPRRSSNSYFPPELCPGILSIISLAKLVLSVEVWRSSYYTGPIRLQITEQPAPGPRAVAVALGLLSDPFAMEVNLYIYTPKQCHTFQFTEYPAELKMSRPSTTAISIFPRETASGLISTSRIVMRSEETSFLGSKMIGKR